MSSNAVCRPLPNGLQRLLQCFLDADGQHVAVLLAQFDASPRQRVLIAAAGVDEHRHRAGMVLFELELREAGIVAAPGEEAERRRMAGVAEEDRRQFAVRPRHGHHRHRVIDRPRQRLALGQQRGHVGLAVVAAIDGERRLAFADLQTRRREIRQRLADQLDAAVDHQRRVFLDQLHLLGLDRIVVDQVVAQPRAAVVVREGEHHLLALELELFGQLGEDAIAHALGHALKVAGDEHDAIAAGVFEGEGLHPQVVQLAVRRALRAVAGEPDGFLRRDDGLGDAGLPSGLLGSERADTRRECGKSARLGQELTAACGAKHAT